MFEVVVGGFLERMREQKDLRITKELTCEV